MQFRAITASPSAVRRENEEVFRGRISVSGALDASEDVNTETMLVEFKIGVNKINVRFEPIAQGTFEDLQEKLLKFVQEAKEDDKQEMILESDVCTYFLWKDNGVYYLFSSTPSDFEGCAYGRWEWDVPKGLQSEEWNQDNDVERYNEVDVEEEGSEVGGGDAEAAE